MGCSTQSVPSWSKVATRCSVGTYCALDRSVVGRAKLRIAVLAAPSFQDGNGSLARSWPSPRSARNRTQRTDHAAADRDQRFSMMISSVKRIYCSPVAFRPLDLLPAFLRARRHEHAPEADVRHAGIGCAPVSGAGPVAGAVSVVAEERTPFLDAQRAVWLAGVETLFRAYGVDRHFLTGPLAVQVNLVPVSAPLPDVAGHV